MRELLNQDSSCPGIYLAKVIQDGSDVKVYIPGITCGEEDKLHLPKALWCAYNLESTKIENISEPMMVMFEGGDIKRPVILSYTVVGSGGSISTGNTGTGVTASGVDVINIVGSEIEGVPQIITFEYQSYGTCLTNMTGWSNISTSQQEVSKYIISNNYLKWEPLKLYNVTNYIAKANELACVATTKKFGKDGDLLYVHFANGEELGCVKVDTKDETWAHGQPATEWGHYDANAISILEMFGATNNWGQNVGTCIDFVVNLGYFSEHTDLFTQSALINYAKTKFTLNGNGSASLTNGSSGNSKIVIEAEKYLGIPYVWGGSSPSGFDCSGLTWYVYKSQGINIPRVADDQRIAAPIKVDNNNLQPGDLVFFGDSGGYASHVGIYAGDRKMIHAPSTGKTIQYTSIDSNYYTTRFICGGRWT